MHAAAVDHARPLWSTRWLRKTHYRLAPTPRALKPRFYLATAGERETLSSLDGEIGTGSHKQDVLPAGTDPPPWELLNRRRFRGIAASDLFPPAGVFATKIETI